MWTLAATTCTPLAPAERQARKPKSVKFHGQPILRSFEVPCPPTRRELVWPCLTFHGPVRRCLISVICQVASICLEFR